MKEFSIFINLIFIYLILIYWQSAFYEDILWILYHISLFVYLLF